MPDKETSEVKLQIKDSTTGEWKELGVLKGMRCEVLDEYYDEEGNLYQNLKPIFY